MRFLMLHGAGTNNRIFEIQTAAIRYELGLEHSFEFVEGSIPAPQEPAIDSLVRPDDRFFAYYDPASASTIAKAVEDLQNYLEQVLRGSRSVEFSDLVKDGPFDAILAFSQGCGLAATWCYRAQRMPIRGVVFFSGEPALSLIGLTRGEVRDLAPGSEEGLVHMPTLHVWGASDAINPERNKQLYEQCDARSRGPVQVHPGAHELPGPGMDRAVQEVVHRIRRLVRGM